jgi:hypothetical protein
MTTTTTTTATETVLVWITSEDQALAGQLFLDACRDADDHDASDEPAMIRDWIGDTMRDDVPAWMLDVVLTLAAECDANAVIAELDDQRDPE